MTQIYANNFTTLVLGRQGENLARQVVFDIRDLESLYGSGTVEVIYQRPGDELPYPVAVQREGTTVTWNVTATDTDMPGDSGKCELRYYVGEVLAKSKTWQTLVETAMDTPSETAPPEPEQGWVDQIIAVGAASKASADAAKADADRAAGVVQAVTDEGTRQVQAVRDEGTTQTANAKAQADAAAQSAAGAAQSAQEAAESAAVYDGVVADVNQLKSDIEDVVHYDSMENHVVKSDVDFSGGTVGLFTGANEINSSHSAYYVSDFIPLDGVEKIYRYGTTIKYYLEAYCLYDADKNTIPNGFHSRTTAYDFEEYEGRNDVVNYDISVDSAKYIRICKDTDHDSEYVYAIKKLAGHVYTMNNDFHAPNIDANAEKVAEFASKLDLIDNDRLLAKSFIKFRSDRAIVFDDTYIDLNNGNMYTGSAYSAYKSSDYIPIDSARKYYTAFCLRINFYDKNRTWLYGINTYGDKTGSGRMFKIEIQDERVAYARLTYAPSNNAPYCGLAEEQDNYEILNLGDSIFGINPVCFDISSIAQEKTGYRFANCGFGGSQASSYPNETSPYYSFNFWKIADAIDSGDFSEQIASSEEIYTNGDASILYQNRIDILTSVDFSKLKLITIGYGTNDFSKAVELDNENNRKDVTTYCGALRYGIEKLLAKYPRIQICLFSPPVKRLGNNNENSSDTTPNTDGKYIKDFCNAMKSVAHEYHLPYFNHYDNMGINDYNWRAFLRDGTHLTYDKGADMFGAKVASEIESLIN